MKVHDACAVHDALGSDLHLSKFTDVVNELLAVKAEHFGG